MPEPPPVSNKAPVIIKVGPPLSLSSDENLKVDPGVLGLSNLTKGASSSTNSFPSP